MLAFLRDGVRDVRTVAQGWRWGVGRRALVPRSAEPHALPPSTRVFSTQWARTPLVNGLREVLLGRAVKLLLHSQATVHIAGLDVFERVRGPVVLVANHCSHMDTPLILNTLPDERRRRTAVAAAADYFFDTWWRAAGSAILFNTFPVERRGGAMASTPGDLLASGWSVVVFPEGTRSPDGWTGRLKLGAAFMASSAGVPVVPVALQGTFNAMPRGQGWPSPGRQAVTVRYGEPVEPMPEESPRDFGRRIEGALSALLDESSTDWYSSRRRALQGSSPISSGPQVARWRRVWQTSRPPVTRGRRRVWR